MNRDELQQVRDWADAKIATGAEPPWAWFQYMKLREVLDQMLAGMDATTVVIVPEDSPQEALRPGNGHLRLVDSTRPDTVQHGPKAGSVQLPT